MEATKENFYEYITSNSDGINKYTPIIANELYQTCFSENTKKTLGINQLYIDNVVQDFYVDKNATNMDVEIAYNEISNLIHKIKLFEDLVSEKDVSIDSKPIYKFEDVINGIKNQQDLENEIDDYINVKTPDGIFNIQRELLVGNIKALLISLMLEILINKT